MGFVTLKMTDSPCKITVWYPQIPDFPNFWSSGWNQGGYLGKWLFRCIKTVLFVQTTSNWRKPLLIPTSIWTWKLNWLRDRERTQNHQGWQEHPPPRITRNNQIMTPMRIPSPLGNESIRARRAAGATEKSQICLSMCHPLGFTSACDALQCEKHCEMLVFP